MSVTEYLRYRLNFTAMDWFLDIKLFCLGAATVIDAALLLTLLDRTNRQRLIVPLFLLVIGIGLYHLGETLQVLLMESGAGPGSPIQNGLSLMMAAGLLLLPSAMLHGLVRAATTGFGGSLSWNRRFGLLYLPVLALIPFAMQLPVQPGLSFAEQTRDWARWYMTWLLAVNLLAGCGFLYLLKSFAAPDARAFLKVLGGALLVLTLVQGFAFFIAPLRWPGQARYWSLLLSLSPLPLSLLVAYFIIRFNFLQLVLERVFIYGVIVTAALLFHQVFLRELWDNLSITYRVDFAIIEAAILVLLVISLRPLRRRSSEALRYLLGARMYEKRVAIRRLVMSMAEQTSAGQQEIIDWFCRQAETALGVEFVAVYLYAADAALTLKSGRGADSAHADTIYRDLRENRRTMTHPGRAQNNAIADALYGMRAVFAVRLEHPSVDGLIVLGRAEHDLGEEQRSMMIMVAEQLAITLHTSALQASRLAAERRAMQNEKLSAIGLLTSSIAHEVKNPLSSIMTIASMMAEDLGERHPHAKDLGLILHETKRLSNTVQQLLQFARPVATRKRKVSMNEVINSTAGVMRLLYHKKGVQLESDSNAADAFVFGDENAMREIVFNLLSNALDAVDSGGKVMIRCARQDNAVQIEVCDNGRGIPEAQLATIFEPFQTSKTEGYGLGLFIVSRHVKDLGGTVTCESSPGEKTCFNIQLPGVAES